jgi:nicotinamide riboside kinase
MAGREKEIKMRKIIFMAIAIIIFSSHVVEAGVQSYARAQREMREIAQIASSRMDWTVANAKTSEIEMNGFKCSAWEATREGFVTTCSKPLTWNKKEELTVQLSWNQEIATRKIVADYTGGLLFSTLFLLGSIGIVIKIIKEVIE